jgi:hypothetical protein
MSGSYAGRSGNGGRKNSRNGGSGARRRPRIGVLVLTLAVLVGIGLGISYLFKDKGVAGPGQTLPPSGNTATDSGKFYDGVFVDDISLGGLTRTEAKKQVEDKQKAFADANGVTVVSPDGAETLLKIADLPAGAYGWDTDALLDEAYKVGREGTNVEQLDYIEQLPENPVKLTTKIKVNDVSALEQRVRGMTAPYFVAPTDAAYIPGSYDATKPAGVDRLGFTEDKDGRQVNPDMLWAAVKEAFETGALGTVQMLAEPVKAAVTLESIKAGYQLIGKYETEIKNSASERRKNIELAGACISGQFVMPGQQFSMNDLTGERTAAKGYQQAPVDNNGIEDVGLAGGVCQVSGTLYNAAIAAGPNVIRIDERNHHSIPSSYMGLGKDATVDYPGKDLKFTNISSNPILIIMYYDYDKSRTYDYHEHAEIYGTPDPEGATYALYVVKVKEIPAKEGYRTVTSSKLKPGETGHVAAHKGYVVDVYLQKTAADGTVNKKFKKLYQDTYGADCEVYTYYKGETPPTPSTSPTATPTSTPTPPTASPPPSPPTASPPPSPPTASPTSASG